MSGTHIGTLSLHDAELVSVIVDRENSAGRLDFRLAGSRSHVAELQGLKAFRCEDLTLQNVVSRVLRSSMKEFSLEDLKYWVMWVTSLSDAHSWLNDERKRDWLEAIDLGKLELVVFEPSAGAQIAAVCEKYSAKSSDKESEYNREKGTN